MDPSILRDFRPCENRNVDLLHGDIPNGSSSSLAQRNAPLSWCRTEWHRSISVGEPFLSKPGSPLRDTLTESVGTRYPVRAHPF